MSTGYKTKVPAMINIQPMAGATLATVEWFCEFWTTSRRLRIDKSEMNKESDNAYLCYVDSAKVGRGHLWAQLTMNIPDSKAPDGYRTEVSVPFPVMEAEGEDKQLYIV